MAGGGVSVRDVDVSLLCLPITDYGGVKPRAQRNGDGVSTLTTGKAIIGAERGYRTG